MTTLGLIIAVLFGVMIRFVFKWTENMKSTNKFNLKLALIAASLSILTNIGLVLIREDITAILPYSYFLAGIYGYTGDSIFRAITKMSTPDLTKKK